MAQDQVTADALQARIVELETKIGALAATSQSTPPEPLDNSRLRNLHNLLLLSDSALPLGSFAFSSGLESYLAHEKPSAINASAAFCHFLRMSIDSVADTTLPYVVQAFGKPARLETLDNDLDASITCSVVRRASVSQGRALLAVWERSFRANIRAFQTGEPQTEPMSNAVDALEAFCKAQKLAALARGQHDDESSNVFAVNCHLPPVFGALGAAFDLSLDDLLYAYLLNHGKMLLSAGIRASVLGPYQSQAILASQTLQNHVRSLVLREMKSPRSPSEAGQCVPLLDIWGGRHEILYSRIFNS